VASAKRSGIIRRVMALRRSTSAFGIHGVTWCGVLAVIGLFVWLNLGWSRHAYVRQEANAWRGGVSLGFPMRFWDAGDENTVTITGAALLLQVKEYGGWRWPGLAVDLLVFVVAGAITAFTTERLTRAISRRRGILQLPAEPTLAPAVQPVTVASPPSRH